MELAFGILFLHDSQYFCRGDRRSPCLLIAIILTTPYIVRLRILRRRILAIEIPPRRITGNVFPDTMQRPFIANYMFIVVSLPDRLARCAAQVVELFRRSRFETTDKCTQ